MKTMTMRCFWRQLLGRAAGTMLVTTSLALPASARNPTISPGGTESEENTAITVDPYLAYVRSFEARSPQLQERSVALQAQLAAQESAVREFLQAPGDRRFDLALSIDRIDRDVEVAELALEEAILGSAPEDGPNFVPAPPLDLERLRKIARHNREALEPPVPTPEPLPALLAPPRETAYLEYLAVRAGTSTFARHLVTAVSHLFATRRELAYRDLTSSARERNAIELAIHAVSQNIRESARNAATAAVVTNW